MSVGFVLIACAIDVAVVTTDVASGGVTGCWWLVQRIVRLVRENAPKAQVEPQPAPQPTPIQNPSPIPVPVPTPGSEDRCEPLNSGRVPLNEINKGHIKTEHGYGGKRHKSQFFLSGSAPQADWDELLYDIRDMAFGRKGWQPSEDPLRYTCDLRVNMGETIGTLPSGQPTSWVLIAADPDTGFVVTMYPDRRKR